MELFELIKENVNSPKQFQLKEISAQTASQLNAQWHSKFPIIDWTNIVRNPPYVCFMFHYKEIPYSVGIWSSPVARLLNDKKTLELRRLAICEEAPRNTASRFIAEMIKDIEKRYKQIETLISYQDTEAHLGTIYKASNWSAVNISAANKSWSNRPRNAEQSQAAKVRWEYKLKARHANPKNDQRVGQRMC